MTTTTPTRPRLELRDYQAQALERTEAAIAAGRRRLLGVAATGLGKTVMFSTLAERVGGRCLVVAHRDELITQAAAKFLEVWPDLGATRSTLEAMHAAGIRTDGIRYDPRGVGIVKAAANDTAARVVVASVQTLAQPRRLSGLVDACGPYGAGPLSLVVVDEAHHAAADTYRKILEALRAGEDDGPVLVGVTATPNRADGLGLDRVFGEIVFSYDLLWGIRRGYLADVRGLRLKLDQLDLGAVKVKAGDYDAGQAGNLMEEAGAPQLIVRGWLEHAADRKTLVYAPTVAMAQHVADEYAAAGVPVGHIAGTTPPAERRDTLARFRADELRVLTNCGVLTEGYDEPSVSCIVVARPTKSAALYVQMVGRGLRLHPEKADCLVIDVVGATDDLSLVTIPSLFGVKKKARARQLGDGSATLSAITAEERADAMATGRLRAEERNLLEDVRSIGKVSWVAVHAKGASLKRYHRRLGSAPDAATVVLVERAPDLWTAGLIMGDGTKRVLLADVTQATAQGVAEDHARRFGAQALVDLDAPWRAKPASPKARALADKWHIPHTPKTTAGELADLIDRRTTVADFERAERARRKAERAAEGSTG